MANLFLQCIGLCIVHIVDWLPTLVGLAGGRVDTETDGVDVWTALTTGQGHTRNTLGMSTFFPENLFNFKNFTHLKEESTVFAFKYLLFLRKP